MAPEVIACDEDPDATYDNRVSVILMLIIIITHIFDSDVGSRDDPRMNFLFAVFFVLF